MKRNKIKKVRSVFCEKKISFFFTSLLDSFCLLFNANGPPIKKNNLVKVYFDALLNLGWLIYFPLAKVSIRVNQFDKILFFL